MEHELVGLTISDGFKFGCGFVLATTMGLLVMMMVLTAFIAIGAVMGIRLPFLG